MGYNVDQNPRQVCLSATSTLHTNYAEKSTASAAFVKLKEITLTYPILINGSMQISFMLREDGGTNGAWGRVYRNGVAIGTNWNNVTPFNWNIFTEDFAFTDLKQSDKIQLYAKNTDGHNTYVKDFKFNAVLSNFYSSLE